MQYHEDREKYVKDMMPLIRIIVGNNLLPQRVSNMYHVEFGAISQYE